MRKLLVTVLILIVLVVVALALVPQFVDINRYHDRIQAELQQRLNRPVSLGHMQLAMFPPRFMVDNAVIGEDPGFNTGHPFAQAQQLQVSVKLLPLLRKQVEINSLELERPAVELVRNSQGEWNFASLGKSPAGSQPASAAPSKPSGQQPPPAQPSGQQKLQVAQLKIDDGSVAITDEQKQQARAVYDHIDLTLKDFAPDKPFAIALAAHLPGQGKQTVALDGKGGPINEAAPLSTPFHGTLKLDQVAISSLQKFLNSPALSGTDAVISGKADVSNQNGQLGSKGSLRVENARIRQVDVGYPITADYEMTDDLNNQVLHLGRTTVKLGDTPLSLSGSVNTHSTPALADLTVQASNVSIAEAARLASAFGVAFNPGMQIAGNLSANVHAQGAVSSPSLSGTVSGRNLAVSGKQLPAPVNVNAVDLELSPQTIKSNSFTAKSGSTAVNVQFSLAQYTTQNPTVDATVNTGNANVAELIHIAQAAGVTSLDGANGSGVLSLNVHATGPLKNAAAMNFTGSGQMQNASLRAAGMTGPLNVRNANLQFTQNSAVLNNLAASVGSTNASGNMTVRNFQAPQVQFALSADKINVLELEKIFGKTPAPPKPAEQKRAGLTLVTPANAATPAAGDPPAPSLLTKTTGTGTLSVGTLSYDQLVLNNVKSNVKLDHGVVQLNRLTSQLYGGSETGSITADLRPAEPVFNVNLKMQKVDSNQLLSSVSNLKDTLYGLLASGAQLSFAAVPTGSDIVRTLNGRMNLNLTNGKITKVDILQQISQVGQFQSLGRQAANFTNIQQLSGDFDIRNGVATTNNLKAVIDGGSLAANGSVDLATQAINMHATAVLSRAQSQTVGGTQIGGFMQTALANQNGELVLPLLVTGTFQNMRFAPDVQQMAQMKAKNLLPSLANPEQLSSGILGALTGKGGQGQRGQGGIGGILGGLAGGQQQQQQQQPNSAAQPSQPRQQQNPLGGVLDGLFGGKKQNK